ncbi:hypothetical protein TNIN_160941, partial [Trichonephila inaurata madagascariensis]
ISTEEGHRLTDAFHCDFNQHSSPGASNTDFNRTLPDLILSCTLPRKHSLTITTKHCGSLLKCMADEFEMHRHMQHVSGF